MTDSEQPPDSTSDFDRHFTAKRFSLLLAVLIVGTFWDVLLGSRTFIFRDFGMFSYPCASFHREAFWRGEMPLWNPLSYCGVPFLAQWNTVTLYPLSLIYLLLPLTWSVSFFCLLHLFIAGIGMYWLAYRWTGCRIAACVAGLAFTFNGMSLSLLIWLSHTAAYALMPWIVLTVEQTWSSRTVRRVALASLLAGAQLLTGSPEVILFTWSIVAALFVAAVLGRQLSIRHAAIPLVATIFIAALLAAAQLLPFFDLLKESQRDASSADSGWAMPIWGWANLFVPLFRTYPTQQNVWFQYQQHWASSYYTGIITVFLAILGAIRVRSYRRTVLVILAVMGLVLALGESGLVFGWVRKVFPAIGFVRYPVKFVILANFAFPILAAFAVAQAIQCDRRSLRIPSLVVLLVFIVTIAVIVWIAHTWPLPKDNWSKTLGNALSCSAFVVIAAAVVHSLGSGALFRRISVAVVLLILLWLDLQVNVPSQNPTAHRSVLGTGWAASKLNFQPEPKHGSSRAMPSISADTELRRNMVSNLTKNYVLARLTLFSDCNLVDEFPKVNGFYSLYPRGTYSVIASLYSVTNRTLTPLMDFLSVSQASSVSNIFEWTNRTTFMPMVTIGQRPVFTESTNAFSQLLRTNVDFREVVYLPHEAQTVISATNKTNAKIVSSKFEGQRISVETEADQPSMLVVSQTHYPGWKAYIDGQPVMLWRANYSFQALEVPPGRHTVLLRYEDKKFYAGAIISLGALAACVVGLAKRSRKSL